MNRSGLVILSAGAISLLLLGSMLASCIGEPPGQAPAETCGDGVCGGGENGKTCPADCKRPGTTPAATTIPASAGESRFGVHVGRLDLKGKISELGDIYSRINIGPDAHGWKIAKGDRESLDSCRSCCRDPGCEKDCRAGYIYYCEPDGREDLVGIDTADGFYADGHDILFSLSPGSYGKKPKNVQDLLSYDYPANLPVYREYLRFLVDRYPRVQYWEVLNEADNPMFWGDTPENYAGLFLLTSREIRSRCPDCRVGISLVGPNPPAEWFFAMTGICRETDFLDLHQYQSETWEELEQFEEQDLLKWKEACPGVEIISTETGIPSEQFSTKGNRWELGGSEPAQAQDSIRYLTVMFSAGYSKVCYYLFDIDIFPGQPDMFEHTGLLTEDNRAKEAFATYKLMIEKLDHFDRVTRLADGQYRYTFSGKGPVYVLWCNSGTCPIPGGISGTVRVTDYRGREVAMDAGLVRITDSPVFVEPVHE